MSLPHSQIKSHKSECNQALQSGGEHGVRDASSRNHSPYDDSSLTSNSNKMEKEFYTNKNFKNEYHLQNLTQTMNNLEYLRNEVKKELDQITLNAIKNKLMLKKRLEKFQKNLNRVEEKYRKFPDVCKLKEIEKQNSELEKEYLTLYNLLNSIKEEHHQLKLSLQNKFNEKVIEFCKVIITLNDTELKKGDS